MGYPQLRPKDTKFMAQFETFDTKQNMFESERKLEQEKIEQTIEERKEYYQNLPPNPEAIIAPSIGTKVAHLIHVVVENAMLIVIIVPILWWLIKSIFKI